MSPKWANGSADIMLDLLRTGKPLDIEVNTQGGAGLLHLGSVTGGRLEVFIIFPDAKLAPGGSIAADERFVEDWTSQAMIPAVEKSIPDLTANRGARFDLIKRANSAAVVGA